MRNVSLLLTPPPTGGIKRRTYSLDAEDDQPMPKRLVMTKEQRPTTSNSIDGPPEKDSDVGDGVLDSLPTGSSAHSVEETIHNEDDIPVKLATSLDETSLPNGISFMKLPQKIRKRIYSLVLTVPAVICVRQNRTPFEHYPLAYSNTDEIKLLPGMSIALTQMGTFCFKSRVQSFKNFNVAILKTNSKVYSEAKKVLYGSNTFDFLNLTKETAPPAEFRIPLFPPGCARMIRSICIRSPTIYAFRWMMTSGHSELKNFYRSLECLTLVLEIDNLSKGWGKKLIRHHHEKWTVYTKRIVAYIATEIFNCVGIAKRIPPWIHLHVMFEGERYSDTFLLNRDNIRVKAKGLEDMNGTDTDEVDAKKQDLKRAMGEAFEIFKKGRR